MKRSQRSVLVAIALAHPEPCYLTWRQTAVRDGRHEVNGPSVEALAEKGFALIERTADPGVETVRLTVKGRDILERMSGGRGLVDNPVEIHEEMSLRIASALDAAMSAEDGPQAWLPIAEVCVAALGDMTPVALDRRAGEIRFVTRWVPSGRDD